MSVSARRTVEDYELNYHHENESPYNRNNDALLDSEEEDLYKRRESDNT